MNKADFSIKTSMLAFVISFSTAQVGALVFLLVLGNFINTESGLGYLLSATILYGLMLVVAIISSKNRIEKYVSSHVSIKKLLIYLMFGIIAYFMLYPIVSCLDALLEKIGFNINSIGYEMNNKNFIFSIFSLAILPSIVEEILFRGVIFKGLKAHGKWFSVLLTSLIFSIYHMSLAQTIYPFLFGILLAGIMYKEDNISYTVPIHFLNNLISLIFIRFNINLFVNHWWYYLLAVTFLIVFAILAFVLLKRVPNKNKQPITRQDKIYLFATIGFMLALWFVINVGSF